MTPLTTYLEDGSVILDDTPPRATRPSDLEDVPTLDEIRAIFARKSDEPQPDRR